MRKVIYFPTGTEPGMKKGYPCILYATKIIQDLNRKYYKGSREKEDAEMGYGGWYLINKCLDYSDEAWELCVDYQKRRSAIEEEWNKLRMSIKKRR